MVPGEGQEEWLFAEQAQLAQQSQRPLLQGTGIGQEVRVPRAHTQPGAWVRWWARGSNSSELSGPSSLSGSKEHIRPRKNYEELATCQGRGKKRSEAHGETKTIFPSLLLPHQLRKELLVLLTGKRYIHIKFPLPASDRLPFLYSYPFV